jgi:molecular chaperone DnaK
MIKDAEANAEEDKKFQELVTTRNMADSLVHSTNQMLDELKEEVSEDEFFSINLVITPPMVSIPNDKGVTTTNRSNFRH